jgi:cytidine deaminase
MAVKVHEAVVRAALEVRERAYARYSKFLVGAALLANNGQIFAGCNIENASYGLTVCAERAAVFAAVAAGEQQFKLLAIATAGGAAPCGACRQVLTEFAPNLPILLIDVARPESVVEVNLRDLLPGAFILNPEPRTSNPRLKSTRRPRRPS